MQNMFHTFLNWLTSYIDGLYVQNFIFVVNKFEIVDTFN